MNGIKNIEIFPNPVYNQLKIKGISEVLNLSIYDLSGQIHFIKTNTTAKSINIDELNQGIYILKIETLQNSHLRKIIKVK